MDRNFRKEPAQQGAGASPPSEAWLFAQALLGKPVPSASSAQADARAKREHLEWLAQISPEDARRVRGQLSEEAEARAQRKQLEWLAAISPEHERKLRSLLQAEASETHERLKWLSEDAAVHEAQWDPAKHPRLAGPPNPGWWATTGGSGGGSSRLDPGDVEGEPPVVDKRNAPPAMLELADAWWKTHNLIQQYRRDIESLPARIASEQAKIDSRDGHSNVHWQNLTKAQRNLAIAKAELPKLEAQSHDLEQRYHDLGYDEFGYATFTPGETSVGGRGIERVGRAVDMGGSPAGLKPTGIEIDVALTAISVLQLGRSALRKAATAAPKNVASQPAALKPYGGAGGGHHIPAKSAFESAAGYNAKAALAIPRGELSRLGVVHSTVTGAQQTLYREFAKTGKQLTWDAVERIETEALVRGGLNSDVARATVKQAVDALKKAGISGPTRIPWGN
jgi:DNA-directed RNA polymerase subunit F